MNSSSKQEYYLISHGFLFVSNISLLTRERSSKNAKFHKVQLIRFQSWFYGALNSASAIRCIDSSFHRKGPKKVMIIIKRLHSAEFIKCSLKVSGHAHRLLDTVCCGASFSSTATLLIGGLALDVEQIRGSIKSYFKKNLQTCSRVL